MKRKREVLDVWDGVLIKQSNTIERIIVSTWSPVTCSLFQDKMKWLLAEGRIITGSIHALKLLTSYFEASGAK